MNRQEKIQELITLFASGEISPEQQQELSVLISETPEVQSELDEALAVWNLMDAGEVEFTPQSTSAWNKVQAQLEDYPQASSFQILVQRFRQRPAFWMGAAAAVAILVTASIVWWPSPEKVTVDSSIAQVSPPSEEENSQDQVFASGGEAIEFYLPDSTHVQLTENSTLRITQAFATADRVVFLEGEAFFDVTHDETNPFVVLTSHTKTKVLGTSFNVRAYPDETRQVVTVATGVVLFRPSDQRVLDSLFLYKSDQGVYDLNISSLVKEPGRNPRLLGGRSNEEKIIERELESPTAYLVPEYDLKARRLAPTAIELQVRNNAQIASYREIKLLVRYTTKKGEREVVCELEGSTQPGESVDGSFKLKDWFRKSELLEAKVLSAQGYLPDNH